METDLGEVRVHVGGTADRLTSAVQSVAFTSGADIYFARGAFRPGTAAGDHLLAHEVAHVAQQRSRGGDSTVTGGPTIGRADDPAEVEAEARAAKITALMRSTGTGPVAAPDVPAGVGHRTNPAQPIRRMTFYLRQLGRPKVLEGLKVTRKGYAFITEDMTPAERERVYAALQADDTFGKNNFTSLDELRLEVEADRVRSAPGGRVGGSAANPPAHPARAPAAGPPVAGAAASSSGHQPGPQPPLSFRVPNLPPAPGRCSGRLPRPWGPPGRRRRQRPQPTHWPHTPKRLAQRSPRARPDLRRRPCPRQHRRPSPHRLRWQSLLRPMLPRPARPKPTHRSRGRRRPTRSPLPSLRRNLLRRRRRRSDHRLRRPMPQHHRPPWPHQRLRPLSPRRRRPSTRAPDSP